MPARERRSARHRAAPPPPPSAVEPQPDHELESYLKALAPSPEESELTGGFENAQVLQVRLPLYRVEQLRRLAEERDVAPAALAREWLVDRLDREEPPTGPLRTVDAPPQPDTGGQFGRPPR
ncbi:MAG: hypothetical protein H0W01_04290 [Pseudonocardiales bacterium]|nr:hypothetical protein [Pseudonocardiales bacterium]